MEGRQAAHNKTSCAYVTSLGHKTAHMKLNLFYDGSSPHFTNSRKKQDLPRRIPSRDCSARGRVKSLAAQSAQSCLQPFTAILSHLRKATSPVSSLLILWAILCANCFKQPQCIAPLTSFSKFKSLTSIYIHETRRVVQVLCVMSSTNENGARALDSALDTSALDASALGGVVFFHGRPGYNYG